MTKLSENFSLEELINSDVAKSKGIDNTPDENIKNMLKKLCEEVLQPIRDRFGSPIKVNSGYRSPKLNKAIGGANNSFHLYGVAVDITSSDNKKLWDLIIRMVNDGVITVGELIDEKKLKWIHISLPFNGKRNKIFKL